MKSIPEIQEILVDELHKNIFYSKDWKGEFKYYNEVLGFTSGALARLLLVHLREEYDDWRGAKWIDDCLITKLRLKNNILTIDGIMIWAIGNDSDWADPFRFSIEFEKTGVGFKVYTFFFGDYDKPALSYIEFKNKSEYWEKGVRNWSYIINFNNLK
jgi:hypothetical protein